MRLLVTGGRDFDDVEFVVTHLNRLHKTRGVQELVHGAARGVDTIAAFWGEEVGAKVIPVPVEDWRDPRGYVDKRAGLRRNQQMLDEYRPDAVFAFPGGTGTADMVERAEKRLNEVWVSHRNFFKKEDPDSWFMSNFARGFGFHDSDGIWWDTSEHYYQAMKTPVPVEREYVRVANTPAEAKRRANEENVKSRDWKARKIDVMRRALSYKFAAGTEAAGLLQYTGIEYLIEYAPWGDTFWGVDRNKVGQNWLGRLLMEHRDHRL